MSNDTGIWMGVRMSMLLSCWVNACSSRSSSRPSGSMMSGGTISCPRTPSNCMPAPAARIFELMSTSLQLVPSIPGDNAAADLDVSQQLLSVSVALDAWPVDVPPEGLWRHAQHAACQGVQPLLPDVEARQVLLQHLQSCADVATVEALHQSKQAIPPENFKPTEVKKQSLAKLIQDLSEAAAPAYVGG